MHRRLLGNAVWCVGVLWCAVTLWYVGGLAVNRQQKAEVSAAVQAFSQRNPQEITFCLRLSGPCEAVLSEQEIPDFLKRAAEALEIPAAEALEIPADGTGSLKYLQKKNGRNYISWKKTGQILSCCSKDAGDALEQYQQLTEQLKAAYQVQGMVCLELSTTKNHCMTEAEIRQDAQAFMAEAGAGYVGEQKEGNLYLYYGYGETLGTGVPFQGQTVNVNLLYRTNGEQTKCILGVPAVQWDE